MLLYIRLLDAICLCILFFRRATVCLSNRWTFYIIISKKKKKNPGLPWVKISKLCQNPNVHFPWEREGYLMAKNPSILVKIQYGLTVTKLRMSVKIQYRLTVTNYIFQNSKIPFFRLNAVQLNCIQFNTLH